MRLACALTPMMGNIARRTVLSVLVLLSTLALPVRSQQPHADPLAGWARVLERFVNEQGEVDFQGLSKDPADLKAFVDYIAKASPESAPALFPTREARLAYYINSYNALSMYNVIDSGIPKALSGFTKISFFGLRSFTIGGKSMSLYTYENRVIRPAGDERVHFALNCMVAGCPRLPRAPFVAERLNEQLDQEARKFFSEPRNLQVVPEKKLVRVSEILKFYEEDFLARSPTLIAYINQYAGERIPEDYKAEFIDYDWTVNDQHRAREQVPSARSFERDPRPR